jgi:hypothetical protein
MLEVLCGHSGGNIAQGGGVEWETINEEAGDFNEAGKYDRGIGVGQGGFEDHRAKHWAAGGGIGGGIGQLRSQPTRHRAVA